MQVIHRTPMITLRFYCAPLPPETTWKTYQPSGGSPLPSVCPCPRLPSLLLGTTVQNLTGYTLVFHLMNGSSQPSHGAVGVTNQLAPANGNIPVVFGL